MYIFEKNVFNYNFYTVTNQLVVSKVFRGKFERVVHIAK